jgi:hypothetical protein
MACNQFERAGALREEQGLPPDAHTESCPECGAALVAYRQTASAITAARPQSHPKSAWEARVFARVAAAPRRQHHRLVRWAVATSATSAALIAIMAYLGWQRSVARDDEEMRQAVLLQQKADEQRKLQATIEAQRRDAYQLTVELDRLHDDLRNARTDADRRRIEEALNAAKRRHSSGAEGAASPHIDLGGDTNDPLKGAPDDAPPAKREAQRREAEAFALQLRTLEQALREAKTEAERQRIAAAIVAAKRAHDRADDPSRPALRVDGDPLDPLKGAK